MCIFLVGNHKKTFWHTYHASKDGWTTNYACLNPVKEINLKILYTTAIRKIMVLHHVLFD